MYLYNNLYHHRTVRRIDLHMREIFRPTIAEMLAGQNPMDNLDAYLGLNDWHLLNEVDRWLRAEPEGSNRHALAVEWARITGRRELKWKLAYEAAFEYRGRAPGVFVLTADELRRRLAAELPSDRGIEFEVDIASLDARPRDPAADRYSALLFDPLDGSLRPDAATQLLDRLPVRNSVVRLFALREADIPALRAAAETVVRGETAPATRTNT